MLKITPIHWRKFEKFLLKMGCRFKYQKGSHRVYARQGLNRPLVIPADRTLPVFIIRNNLRLLSVGHEKYLEVLKDL